MLKYTLLLINSISILLFNLFFGDGVTVTANFPSKAQPGSEFPVEVVVNKGSVGGFAKLQIELPTGFTAKELENKGASFSSSGNTAKFIWTALPSEEEFTVKFIVVADASASGTKLFQGKFSYIVSNNKQQAEFGPVEVLFGEGDAQPVVTNTETPASNEVSNTETPVNTATETPVSTATETPVTTNTASTTPQFFNPTVDPNAAVSATRTIQQVGPDVFDVYILIKKENVKGFAKYLDKIPDGFVAEGMETNGSSFTFSDHNAKFVWVSLPAEEEMKISYKLKMETKPSGTVMLSGDFSYLENDQTQKIKAADEELKINGEQPVVVNGTIAQPENTTSEEPVTTNTVEPVTTNTVVEEPASTTNNTGENPANTNNEPSFTNNNTASSGNKIGGGNVNFHVQIGAFQGAMSSDRIASMYNISENINTVMHQGLTKFMIGDFDEYKSARDKRETTKSKGVKDAFVVAYSSGKRITVQEALMISNQKWFR